MHTLRRVGSCVCKHGRYRSECRDCGGGSICEHSRKRSQCKECGGSQIREHHRVRSSCKACGAPAHCEHGRQKSRCKECKARKDLLAAEMVASDEKTDVAALHPVCMSMRLSK